MVHVITLFIPLGIIRWLSMKRYYDGNVMTMTNRIQMWRPFPDGLLQRQSNRFYDQFIQSRILLFIPIMIMITLMNWYGPYRKCCCRVLIVLLIILIIRTHHGWIINVALRIYHTKHNLRFKIFTSWHPLFCLLLPVLLLLVVVAPVVLQLHGNCTNIHSPIHKHK